MPDEKIIKYSGIASLLVFFASVIIAIIGAMLPSCATCSNSLHFYWLALFGMIFLAPLVILILLVLLAFPIASIFFAKRISNNSLIKIIFLMGNIAGAIFFAFQIIVNPAVK
jgi:hypothetical protein